MMEMMPMPPMASPTKMGRRSRWSWPPARTDPIGARMIGQIAAALSPGGVRDMRELKEQGRDQNQGGGGGGS